MAHAIWKGSISFGLVNIPVALYPAEGGEHRLDFSLLDKRDLSPVGYRKVSKVSGEEVAGENLVKGYEYEEGRYVVLGDEDFRRASMEATQTVEIKDFVDASSIHPVYFNKPYYLAPVRKGQKSYALLRETLRRTRKAGIAKVVIHTREYIGVVMAYGDALLLNLLRYADELRSAATLDLPGDDLDKLGVTEQELKMAEKLVEGMGADWEPGKYHDTYSEELLSYINRKIEAGETEAALPEPLPEEERPTRGKVARGKVIDLMALLKKSVEKAESEKHLEEKRPKRRKKASRGR